MKKIFSIMLIVGLAAVMAGCSNEAVSETVKDSVESVASQVPTEEQQVVESEASKEQTKTIVDHEGTEMEIPVDIDRIVIVSRWPMAAQLAAYLGGAEKIVGMPVESMSAAQNGILGEVYPEILNASTKFHEGENINLEELLKLEPDIVIGPLGETAENIRAMGIPTVGVSTTKWDSDVLTTTQEWLKLLDQIFGESELTAGVEAYTKKVQEDMAQRISTLTEEERKKVMFLYTYSDAALGTATGKSFGQAWCDYTGSINVGQGLDESAIDMEQVYEWNPEVIFITNFTSAQPEDLYHNTIGSDDWSTVEAVKNGEVYKMPLGWYRAYTPGIDVPVTLQWMAKCTYPELFEDWDITEITKNYFKEYFAIELEDEQVERMFNPPREASGY